MGFPGRLWSGVRGAIAGTGLACAAGAGAAAVVAAGLYVQAGTRLDEQRDRNEFLRKEVRKLDAEISEVRGLDPKGMREQVAAIAASRVVVGSLGRERVRASRLLAAIAELPPDAVFLTGASQDGAHVRIEGRATRHEDVIVLLERVIASPVLADPRILHVGRSEGERISASFPIAFAIAATVRRDEPKAGGVK